MITPSPLHRGRAGRPGIPSATRDAEGAHGSEKAAQAGITFRLPAPPSTNALYIARPGKRFKSDAYTRWLTDTGWDIKLNGWRPERGLRGEVRLHIKAPENGRRDLDNHAKPVLDLMVSMGVIESDRNKCVRKILMEWHDGTDLIVTVTPCSPSALTPEPSQRPKPSPSPPSSAAPSS